MFVKLKARNLGLVSVGLFLIIASSIWAFVIFPSLNKLPADHYQIINLEGTYQVMNPTTQSMDEMPVMVKREQQAVEIQDDVLIINEAVSSIDSTSGENLSQFVQVEVLGVDRSSRENVPGFGDMDRSGQFSFPGGLEKRTYNLWIPSAGRPLEAKFAGESEFHGLKVFDFRLRQLNLDIGIQADTGLPQSLDFWGDMKVEPVSGATVSSESKNILKVAIIGLSVPVFISDLKFTSDTTAELINTAKNSRNVILWSRVYALWIGIALGIALIIAGIFSAVRAKVPNSSQFTPFM